MFYAVDVRWEPCQQIVTQINGINRFHLKKLVGPCHQISSEFRGAQSSNKGANDMGKDCGSEIPSWLASDHWIDVALQFLIVGLTILKRMWPIISMRISTTNYRGFPLIVIGFVITSFENHAQFDHVQQILKTVVTWFALNLRTCRKERREALSHLQMEDKSTVLEETDGSKRLAIRACSV